MIAIRKAWTAYVNAGAATPLWLIEAAIVAVAILFAVALWVYATDGAGL